MFMNDFKRVWEAFVRWIERGWRSRRIRLRPPP